MRWPWSKRPPLPMMIPTYREPLNHAPAPPSAEGLHVEEHQAEESDVEALRLAQSQTGIHRAWKRITDRGE